MPETADVGDGGSVFAPASGAHKRRRIEKIHRTVNKQNPPCKKICLGGGRVSGRSRENLISGLISRADIVLQQVTPVEENHARASERHLPASFHRERTTALSQSITGTVDSLIPHLPESAPREIHPPLDFNNLGYIPHGGPTLEYVQFTARGPVTLTAEEAVRRYSVIHAETEAARARWDAETEEAAQRWAESLSDIPQAIVSQQPAPSHSEVLASTTILPREGVEVVLAPTTIPTRESLEVGVAVTTIPTRENLEVGVAVTTIRQLSGDEVVVAHAAVAQEVLAPTPGAQPTDRQEVSQPASQPIQVSSSTQTIYSMLQSFAFDDTRSAYNDDEFEYPLN